jgi:hypothetical protein
VYFGTAGKALLMDHAVLAPWYVYAAVGGAVLLGVRTIGKVAADAISAMELEEKQAVATAADDGEGGGGERSSSVDR